MNQSERSHSALLTCPVKSGGVRCSEYPDTEWGRVASTWSMLAVRTRSSFFLTAEWIESWLETFGNCLNIALAVFESESDPVGAALLVQTRGRRMTGGLERISLNASGEGAGETTYIEFNHLLCLPGWEERVAGSIAERLRATRWDEFALDGFLPGAGYDALKRALAPLAFEEVRHPSYYVDLAAVRSQGSYERSLSSHRRKLYRQNVRAYSATGPLRVERGQDPAAAQAIFEELSVLNRQRQ